MSFTHNCNYYVQTLNQNKMKKIFFIVAVFATVFVQQSFAQEIIKTSTSPLLISYYNLKDALVSSNVNAVAASAIDFAKTINESNKETVNDENRNALLSDATAIAKTKDLKVQREKFAALSTNMYAVAKAVKLAPDPIYRLFCPMKKASWLSSSKVIKNPYYGSAMLTCGSVKEIL